MQLNVLRPAWHVPDDVRLLRLALVAAEPGTPTSRVVAAATPLRASLLLMEECADAVDALVTEFNRLVRDGCAPEQVCFIGAGALATAPLAASLLLRSQGAAVPFGAAAVTGTTRVVLRLAGTSADELIHHLVAVATCPGGADGLDESLRLASIELDQLLSATDC